MEPKIPIAAVTDEFSPDLETALEPMAEIGMKAAELRVVFWQEHSRICPRRTSEGGTDSTDPRIPE